MCVCMLLQDQLTCANVFKKWLQYLEYPEELHWDGENDVHIIFISYASGMAAPLATLVGYYFVLWPNTCKTDDIPISLSCTLCLVQIGKC